MTNDAAQKHTVCATVRLYTHGGGIHGRPSCALVLLTNCFISKISLRNLARPEEVGNARSIMYWMGMTAGIGASIEISAMGEDAKLAVESLKAALECDSFEQIYEIRDRIMKSKLGISE